MPACTGQRPAPAAPAPGLPAFFAHPTRREPPVLRHRAGEATPDGSVLRFPRFEHANPAAHPV